LPKITESSELKPFLCQDRIEAGCDEAGRGCLSGPVVAAAVILPKDYRNSLLNDSKKLSEQQRSKLRKEIESVSLAFAVGIVDESTIDQINILNASFLAMHRALDKLSIRPQHLVIDGNRFNRYNDIPHSCIIKGDGKFLHIAAASILAKTYRDDLMLELDLKFPNYGWKKNKGYPTIEHRKAIAEYGETPHHRKSFTLFKENQLKLF
jgi:ribonuclease HII